MTERSLYSWEPREAGAEHGKMQAGFCTLRSHPAYSSCALSCCKQHFNLCDGRKYRYRKKKPVVDNFIFRPWLKNLISTPKKPGNKWHQRPRHKVLFLFRWWSQPCHCLHRSRSSLATQAVKVFSLGCPRPGRDIASVYFFS